MRERLYLTLKEERELRKFEKEHRRQDAVQSRWTSADAEEEAYRNYRLALEKYLVEAF